MNEEERISVSKFKRNLIIAGIVLFVIITILLFVAIKYVLPAYLHIQTGGAL